MINNYKGGSAMRLNALKLLASSILKLLIIFIIVSSLIYFGRGGCIWSSKVTFDQLFSDPEIYDNRNITIEGFYFYSFENVILSESLEYSGSEGGSFSSTGRDMWVEGVISREAYDALYENWSIWRYGKVSMTGKFEYGESYGHLGLWDMQITPTKTVILPWTPPALESLDGE
jgi:hypothetical protein